MRVFKFVSWDIKPPMPNYSYEDFIKNYDRHCSSVMNALRYGYLKQGGWCYDFSDELKKFAYKDQWGDWHEVYAPNKTAIRKSVYYRVLKIIKL